MSKYKVVNTGTVKGFFGSFDKEKKVKIALIKIEDSSAETKHKFKLQIEFVEAGMFASDSAIDADHLGWKIYVSVSSITGFLQKSFQKDSGFHVVVSLDKLSDETKDKNSFIFRKENRHKKISKMDLKTDKRLDHLDAFENLYYSFKVQEREFTKNGKDYVEVAPFLEDSTSMFVTIEKNKRNAFSGAIEINPLYTESFTKINSVIYK